MSIHNMGKRKNRAKRSVSRTPKGVPHKDAAVSSTMNINPFESNSHRSAKRPKFTIHNRHTGAPLTTATFHNHHSSQKQSALANAIQQRREMIRADQKTNIFRDHRIGIRRNLDDTNDIQLARLVKERSNQSKRSKKYQLDDEVVLTHRGKALGDAHDHAMDDANDLFLTEQEEAAAVGEMDEADTSLHFGGHIDGTANSSYGRTDLSSQYLSRKTELDDLIARRKLLKAEKQKSKGTQEDVFSELDNQFKELSQLLDFRDKEKYEREHLAAKQQGQLDEEDAEMAEWDLEMKAFMVTSEKVKATDRTKTAEEIAQQEADRLHELETKRLARMHGDFENDDLADVDVSSSFPEAIVDHDDGNVKDRKGPTVKFTADGLMNVDKDGNITGEFGQEIQKSDDETDRSSRANDVEQDDGKLEDGDVEHEEMDDEKTDQEEQAKLKPKQTIHKVGAKVMASYRADEQYGCGESWFSGTIVKVHEKLMLYDIQYDDGDFEEKVKHANIHHMEKENSDDVQPDPEKDEAILRKKRAIAKEMARAEIPYVFEVPTTMEALNDMIGTYATTGAEASLIIERIHKANSVRLNKNNNEKMQNFTDVLLRRFIAIGDSIYEDGDGGKVSRYSQLDALTQTLFEMAQDSPETSAAVWSRRLGFLQLAHQKRLRDVEFEQENDFTVWPSTGTILLLKALGHIFPVTDKRHAIVTPALLFLCEVISFSPILSVNDLVSGLACCALALEYTKEAKRIVPEALAFLSGVIQLFGSKPKSGPLQTLNSAIFLQKGSLLKDLLHAPTSPVKNPTIILEREKIQQSDTIFAVLYATLQLVEACTVNLADSLASTKQEAFACFAESILTLRLHSLPQFIQEKVRSLISTFDFDATRKPLQRRLQVKFQVKSLAPRIESLSTKKVASTTTTDRMRREYKRERKAVARELRLDASIVESERRAVATQKGDAARAKRHRAHAWLEQEQATINNQVRQGGGLLSGGGIGAARAKAATAKLGMKKGGKL